jgi:hypothetical protein
MGVLRLILNAGLSRVLPVYTVDGVQVVVPWWRVVVTLSPVVVGGALFFFVFFHALEGVAEK